MDFNEDSGMCLFDYQSGWRDEGFMILGITWQELLFKISAFTQKHPSHYQQQQNQIATDH
jgi:hypothetical protein